MKPLKNNLTRNLELPGWWGEKMLVRYNAYYTVCLNLESPVIRVEGHLKIGIERGLLRHETIKK